MSKWLSLLLFPLQQVLLLLAASLLTLLLGRRRVSGALLALGLGWLYLCACPPVADYLMGRLERDYPPRAAIGLPAAPAMVLLCGATRGDVSPLQSADLNARADRLVFATELYRLGKAPVVLVSGGSAGHSRPEAREVADILAIMGVPGEALLLEERSRNTYENALYSAGLLRERGIGRVLLVTSAFHMPRARAAFEARGIEVIPAATDYQRLEHGGLLPDLLPSLGALTRTTYALREMAGTLVYRWRGYL